EHEKNLARWADHPALGKMRIKGNDRESRLRLAFQLLALLFVLLALAEPRLGKPSQGEAALSIVVDLSKSMEAVDAQGRPRIERAKDTLQGILDGVSGFRASLTVFAKETRTLVPLTSDLRAVQTMSRRMKLGELEPGSDLEKALALGAARLPNGGTLLLLTDGEELSGKAEQAKLKGVRVFALGFGSEEGTTLAGEPDLWGNATVHQYKGEPVVTRLNQTLLERIARKSGGKYWQNPTPEAILPLLQATDENNHVCSLAWIPIFLALCFSLFPRLFQLFCRLPLPLLLALLLVGWTPFDFAQNQAALQAAKGNRWPEATRHLAEASKQSRDPRILYNYGSALYQEGRYREAEAQFKKALASPRIERQARYNLGNALFRQNRFQEAIEQYQKTLALDPRDEDARFNLALAQERLKKNRKPKAKNPEKKQEGPSNAEIDEALGMLEAAEREYQAQVRMKPSPSPSGFDLRRVFSGTEPDW
ncbi:MAG: tetratricopeptide repeat protein, partial [Bacteroidota bacterium]